MRVAQISRSDAYVAILILGYVLLLLLLPILLEQGNFDFAFSEDGPFEQLSILAWIIAALVIIVRIRPLGSRALAFAVLFMCFAAREADWHKAFTADSILKTNYYKHASAPLGEKLIAVLVALLFISLIVYAGIVIFRFLFLQGGWRSRSGFWLMFGSVLVVLGKMLDRAPAILIEEYGIALHPIVGLYAAGFEEGLEMLHPLILAWSVWISQKETRYLD